MRIREAVTVPVRIEAVSLRTPSQFDEMSLTLTLPPIRVARFG